MENNYQNSIEKFKTGLDFGKHIIDCSDPENTEKAFSIIGIVHCSLKILNNETVFCGRSECTKLQTGHYELMREHLNDSKEAECLLSFLSSNTMDIKLPEFIFDKGMESIKNTDIYLLKRRIIGENNQTQQSVLESYDKYFNLTFDSLKQLLKQQGKIRNK